MRLFGLLLLPAAITLVLSTSTSSASSAPRTENLDALGSAPGSGEYASGLTSEIHQAERNNSGNLLSVTWSIENNTDERVVLTWISDRSYTYSGPYFSGVTVLDQTRGTRHHPIMDGEGGCLCSGNFSASFKERLEPNEKIAYWSLFSVPEDVETVTVEIPNFDPIEDIPIS